MRDSHTDRANALVRGELSLMGRRVRLSDVTCPLLAVTFEPDNIVPHRSASALVERAGSADKQHLHLPGGHVGAVVSSGAKAHLWPTLTAWWAARDV